MDELFDQFDIWSAFGQTIYLAFFSALGALILGTVLAVMRVGPVGIAHQLEGLAGRGEPRLRRDLADAAVDLVEHGVERGIRHRAPILPPGAARTVRPQRLPRLPERCG